MELVERERCEGEGGEGERWKGEGGEGERCGREEWKNKTRWWIFWNEWRGEEKRGEGRGGERCLKQLSASLTGSVSLVVTLGQGKPVA